MLRCVVCQKPFQPKRKTQVTCSTECSQNRYQRQPDVELTCSKCSTPFTGHPRRKFCTDTCRELFYKEKFYYLFATPERTEDYYVYVWFNGDMPFYVGQGEKARAWQEHPGYQNPTRVVIIQDRLTKEGALLAEAVLIHALRALGFTLVNVALPLARQEVPPLSTTT